MPNSNNKPQHQHNPLPSLADSSQPAIGAPTGTEPLASGSAEAGVILWEEMELLTLREDLSIHGPGPRKTVADELAG